MSRIVVYWTPKFFLIFNFLSHPCRRRPSLKDRLALALGPSALCSLGASVGAGLTTRLGACAVAALAAERGRHGRRSAGLDLFDLGFDPAMLT